MLSEARPTFSDERANPKAWKIPLSAAMTAPWFGAAGSGLAAFLVYFHTLAVTIVWGDSPELTAAAYTAGVPHPTGYPLYMLIAHAFLRICPWGTVAFRMNLLSAFSASLATAMLYLLMWRMTRSRRASLTGALLYAFSATFWSQAVIAEVYAFQLLCTTCVLGSVLAWDRRGERRWLFTAMAAYGLCFTHHMMSVLMAPGLLYFALSSRHRSQFLRELPRTIPLFLLPLCLYAYLPLAALRSSPLNWNDPSNWENFLRHVSGRQYQPAMFHLTAAQLWGHLREYTGCGEHGPPGILPPQFGAICLCLAPIGAWSLARRRPRLFGLTLLLYLVDLGYALNYLVPDVDVYYLPSHLIVAIWIACGVRQLEAGLSRLGCSHALEPAARRRLRQLVASALVVLPILPLTAHWSSNDHHQDRDALNYAHATLATLKPHAILFGEGDFNYFPLLYAHYVERCRPDVTMLEEYNVLCPARLRLSTRLAREGLVVRVPSDFQHGHRNGVRDNNGLLKQLLHDNIGRRPIYVCGPPDLLRTQWLGDAIAPYCHLVNSDLSCIELALRPPLLSVKDPKPQYREPVSFTVSTPYREAGSELELLGFDAQPSGAGAAETMSMTYYWRIFHQPTAGAARVWVMFTDDRGNYPRSADGSPLFHNIHPLAYGLGDGRRLPHILRESYSAYVPPSARGRRWHVRIAVAEGGQFLTAGRGTARWAELGQIGPPSGMKVAARVQSKARRG